MDTLLRQVDAQAKGVETEDEGCDNAVAPRIVGSITTNLSSARGRAKAFAKVLGVGQGNATFGMIAALSMSVLLAGAATMGEYPTLRASTSRLDLRRLTHTLLPLSAILLIFRGALLDSSLTCTTRRARTQIPHLTSSVRQQGHASD